jgi:hypothetical protein
VTVFKSGAVPSKRCDHRHFLDHSEGIPVQGSQVTESQSRFMPGVGANRWLRGVAVGASVTCFHHEGAGPFHRYLVGTWTV